MTFSKKKLKHSPISDRLEAFNDVSVKWCPDSFISTGSDQLPVFGNSNTCPQRFSLSTVAALSRKKCIYLMQSTLRRQRKHFSLCDYRSKRKLFLAYICFTVHKFIHTCSDVIHGPVEPGLAYALSTDWERWGTRKKTWSYLMHKYLSAGTGMWLGKDDSGYFNVIGFAQGGRGGD